MEFPRDGTPLSYHPSVPAPSNLKVDIALQIVPPENCPTSRVCGTALLSPWGVTGKLSWHGLQVMSGSPQNLNKAPKCLYSAWKFQDARLGSQGCHAWQLPTVFPFELQQLLYWSKAAKGMLPPSAVEKTRLPSCIRGFHLWCKWDPCISTQWFHPLLVAPESRAFVLTSTMAVVAGIYKVPLNSIQKVQCKSRLKGSPSRRHVDATG